MLRLLLNGLFGKPKEKMSSTLVAERADTSDIKCQLMDNEAFVRVKDGECDFIGVGVVEDVYIDISGRMILVTRMRDRPPEMIRQQREEKIIGVDESETYILSNGKARPS